jgi:hypothetical protein
LFGAWLEAGIMGAIFWAVVALRSGLVLLRGQLSAMGKFTPVAYVIFVSFFWEVLFSPFGGEKRIWNGFLLWLIVVIPFIATRAKASAVQPRPVHV